MASFYDTIYLFYRTKEEGLRELPKNVVLNYIEVPNVQMKKTVLKRNFFFLIYLGLNELFFSRQKGAFIKNLKYNLTHILNCIYYSEQLVSELNKETLNSAGFYSYWFFDWNFSLSILKHKKIIKKSFTRAHGYDLYENNGKPNYLPSRKFCLKNTDFVFPVSKMGETYLKQLYPNCKNKIGYQYLGTKYFGINPFLPNDSYMHIVSCSSMFEVKRIDLIVEILKNFKINVLWTHIGDGYLRKTINEEAKKLPENIKYDFKGMWSQKQIFDFYKTISIDFFINCSSSEGLPVSIMEAISFGIPVIATDVGGTKEIVNKSTGILINKEFNPAEVAQSIMELKNNKNILTMRNEARLFWKSNFYYENNYTELLKKIDSINKGFR
ncbi:MAG TPA: glycosyltransferase [Bacteroidia bacterium]|nr:glycosyltransferase [Bacteroidia bacterium]